MDTSNPETDTEDRTPPKRRRQPAVRLDDYDVAADGGGKHGK